MIHPRLFAVLFAVLGALSASAHTVWIEAKEGALVARFAEPGNEFETSPGFLDSLSPPAAFTVVTNSAVAIESPRQHDHFRLAGASASNVACLETAFTVRGGRKPYFYARWQPANGGLAQPLLTLDVVPTGKPGEARAYFRGKPLANASATLRGPDGAEQQISGDAGGHLHFTGSLAGLYILSIAHYREPLAGFHHGVAYSETSHNCALSWQN